MRPFGCLGTKPGNKNSMTETHKDSDMTIKQANVVIYATVCIKVNGAEGETYEEIIENAEEAIDDRVIGDLKKEYVEPNSPTAKNLMGEVAYFEMEESQPHHFVVIENEFQDSQTEKEFENHPLGYGPVPVNEKGEDASVQAFKLLEQIVGWEDDRDSMDALRDGRLNEWIDKARLLVADSKNRRDVELENAGKFVLSSFRDVLDQARESEHQAESNEFLKKR